MACRLRTSYSGRTSDRSIEERQPAREVLLDRQLLFELRLQLELRGVVALLVLPRGDERPERAALVAVDEVDGMLAALEAKDRREQLRPEAARLELGADEVDGRDEVLEVVVLDDDPVVAELVFLPRHARAGVARRDLEQLVQLVLDADEVA